MARFGFGDRVRFTRDVSFPSATAHEGDTGKVQNTGADGLREIKLKNGRTVFATDDEIKLAQ